MRVLRIYHSGVVADWRARERELSRLGLDVRLVSSRRWNEGGAIVELDDSANDVVGAATIGRHPYRFAFDPRPILRELRRRPTIVDLHEEPGSVAAAEVLLLLRLTAARDVRVVFYSAQNIAKRYPLPFRAIERWTFSRAHGAYVCNVEAGDVLRAKGFKGRIRVIPLGVSDDVAARARTTARRDAEYRIGYVGRLEHHKGVHVLLDAVARLHTGSLHVYGDGPQAATLRQQSERLGIQDRVSFHGFTDRRDMAATYAAIDVLVVPSLVTPAWKEQFGRVAAEAMRSGVPVIASATGSLPEVVGDAGLLVPADDPAALAAALIELADPAQRQHVASRARARSERFTWHAIAAEHAALYREVTSGT